MILILALLAMNVASTAHADCAGGLCNDTQVMTSVDSSHDDDQQQNTDCECCATCSGHHHHQSAVLSGKIDHAMNINEAGLASDGAVYLSQLHYPPSKPPKA